MPLQKGKEGSMGYRKGEEGEGNKGEVVTHAHLSASQHPQTHSQTASTGSLTEKNKLITELL